MLFAYELLLQDVCWIHTNIPPTVVLCQTMFKLPLLYLQFCYDCYCKVKITIITLGCLYYIETSRVNCL